MFDHIPDNLVDCAVAINNEQILEYLMEIRYRFTITHDVACNNGLSSEIIMKLHVYGAFTVDESLFMNCTYETSEEHFVYFKTYFIEHNPKCQFTQTLQTCNNNLTDFIMFITRGNPDFISINFEETGDPFQDFM